MRIEVDRRHARHQRHAHAAQHERHRRRHLRRPGQQREGDGGGDECHQGLDG